MSEKSKNAAKIDEISRALSLACVETAGKLGRTLCEEAGLSRDDWVAAITKGLLRAATSAAYSRWDIEGANKLLSLLLEKLSEEAKVDDFNEARADRAATELLGRIVEQFSFNRRAGDATPGPS